MCMYKKAQEIIEGRNDTRHCSTRRCVCYMESDEVKIMGNEESLVSLNS